MELLVVIAIVALLMAMLLPSLQKSRAIAQQRVCGSNLHQIYLGFASYAGEWNDYIPGGTTWNTVLGKAYFGSPKRYGPFTSTFGWQTDRWDIYHCPGEPVEKANTADTNYSQRAYGNFDNELNPMSYGINFGVSGLNWTAGLPRRGFSRGGLMASPFQAPLVMDTGHRIFGWTAPVWYAGVDSTPGNNDLYGGGTAFYHPGETTNMLYLDGHIKDLRPTWVTGEPIFNYVWYPYYWVSPPYEPPG